jgi:hypothetical protein
MNKIIKMALVALFSVLFLTSAYAAPCRGNGWQPTFVHDLTYADGPWYVMPNGAFRHMGIRNGGWTAHACNLIGLYGVRNQRGFTNCRAYTRIQCGCQRGLSESNLTCRSFLSIHTKKHPIGNY